MMGVSARAIEAKAISVAVQMALVSVVIPFLLWISLPIYIDASFVGKLLFKEA
jgi:hypothetical protein